MCGWHMTTSKYIMINKVLCCHFFMYRRGEFIGRLFKLRIETKKNIITSKYNVKPIAINKHYTYI